MTLVTYPYLRLLQMMCSSSGRSSAERSWMGKASDVEKIGHLKLAVPFLYSWLC